MKAFMEPMLYVNGWRFVQIGALLHLWMAGSGQRSSFILIMLLLVMASLRWRWRLPVWTVAIDGILCAFYVPYTEVGYYGFALVVFELMFRGRPLLSLLLAAALSGAALAEGSVFMLWFCIQALLFGAFSFVAARRQQASERDADEQRKARRELEHMRVELLEANRLVSGQAELMERNRIARQLHDHLGHDLTGALLALQAYEYVQNPDEARQLLLEVRKRLERGAAGLRQTVHNMAPTAPIGVESLEYAARNFGRLDIQFHKAGDMQRVPAHVWGLLEACLKEALTNVARHSNATGVEAGVQVADAIVRLYVQDNGTAGAGHHTGSGLRSLQLRARALGGSLSVDRNHGFLLVCVIPLEKGTE